MARVIGDRGYQVLVPIGMVQFAEELLGKYQYEIYADRMFVRPLTMLFLLPSFQNFMKDK